MVAFRTRGQRQGEVPSSKTSVGAGPIYQCLILGRSLGASRRHAEGKTLKP